MFLSGNSLGFCIFVVMVTTYRLNVNELSVNILHSIQEAFKGKDIEITISESMDETGYLLASEANKKDLFESIQQLESGNGITMTIDELHKKYRD